jgi:hypothetical protein
MINDWYLKNNMFFILVPFISLATVILILNSNFRIQTKLLLNAYAKLH